MLAKQISIFIENKEGRLAEVTAILRDANVNIRALPTIDKFIQGGQNKLCYAFVLGVCHMGDRCHFIHADHRDITDIFCNNLCPAIRPGVSSFFCFVRLLVRRRACVLEWSFH